MQPMGPSGGELHWPSSRTQLPSEAGGNMNGWLDGRLVLESIKQGSTVPAARLPANQGGVWLSASPSANRKGVTDCGSLPWGNRSCP